MLLNRKLLEIEKTKRVNRQSSYDEPVLEVPESQVHAQRGVAAVCADLQDVALRSAAKHRLRNLTPFPLARSDAGDGLALGGFGKMSGTAEPQNQP